MMDGTHAPVVNIVRKSSIETEPRTLNFDQIQFAREAAMYVLNTRTAEEAMRIFTEGLEPVLSPMEQNENKRMDSIKENLAEVQKLGVQSVRDTNEDDKLIELQFMRNIASSPF